MMLSKKKDDEYSNIAVSTLRSASIWLGWMAMIVSRFEMAGASRNSAIAFAGMGPNQHQHSSRLHDRQSGWLTRCAGPLHAPLPEGGRRKAADPTLSSRLLLFPFGTLADPDSLEDNQEDPETPKPMQTNFDKLFTGMPKINEILGSNRVGDKPPPASRDEPRQSSNRKKKPTGMQDDQWLENKMEELKEKYDERLEEAVNKLNLEREKDPESVPDSAYDAVESMLKEEIENELTESREQRFQDMLKEAEARRLEELESTDLTGVENPVVDEIMKEASTEADRLEALQAEMDSFIQYEQDASRRVERSDVEPLEDSTDLDMWALDRMKEMLLASHQSDTDSAVSETLEETIDELQDRLESKKEPSLVQPETMKEWQMYRSIATRLSKGENATGDDSIEDEEAIAAQLQSWKEFQQKEQEYRRRSGLTSGVEMPFEWQEAVKDPLDDLKSPAPLENDNRSPKEVRADLNRKALNAMEDLVKRGTIRSQRVVDKIEQLKQYLESPEELNEEEDEPESMDPVDLTGVFGSDSPPKEPASPKSSTWIEETDVRTAPPDTPFFSDPGGIASETSSRRPPPDTAFFSTADDNDIDSSSPAPPPDTPFFTDDSDGSDEDLAYTEDTDRHGESKLGTLEEQKLRSMYRRAGARTASEQENIRSKWEEYQKYEKESRDISGLSDVDDSLDKAEATSRVSGAIKDDGDVDAAKILAAIGPRPTKKGKNATRTDSLAIETPDNAPAATITEQEKDQEKKLRESNLDRSDVSDQMYRAVAAVGGGRTRDDPEAKAKEKADFEEYLRKEEEARQSLDVMDDVTTDGATPETGGEGVSDDIEYAEKALESIGPRPEIKGKKDISAYEREYSDTGSALSDNEVGDDDDIDDAGSDEGSLQDLLPDWYRKEQKEAKSKSAGGVAEAFLGEGVDEEEEYEEKIRQAEEFGRRRSSSRRRQMGIDISDVLGNRGNEDFNDYSYEDYSSPVRDSSSFRSRKANLLEYTELDVREVNALMDHKESPYATGVSRYMKKINKPFRDFGAIFRLEGTLVDISGLQYEAWKRVAEAFDFKPPELEDVRLAAVSRPEIAVRKFFFWSDDYLFCRDVAVKHRQFFRDVFNEWEKDQDFKASTGKEEEPGHDTSDLESTTDIGEPSATRTPLTPRTEKELLDLQWLAWTKTAEKYDFEPPSRDDIMVSVVVSPGDAIRGIFRWTTAPSKIPDIVKTYQVYLSELLQVNADDKSAGDENDGAEQWDKSSPRSTYLSKLDLEFMAWTKTAVECGFEEPTQQEAWAAMMINDPYAVVEDGFCWAEAPSEIEKIVTVYKKAMKELIEGKVKLGMEYNAWTRTAMERGFEEPTLQEAWAAMMINDPYAVVEDGFCWSEEPSEIEEIVTVYRNSIKELEDEYGDALASSPGETETEAKTDQSPSGPTAEEMFEMQVFSWTVAAEKHGFDPPLLEEIQLAENLDEKEAITRLFRWSDDESVVDRVSDTYREARRKISNKIIQKYNLEVNGGNVEMTFAGENAATRKSPTNDEMFQLAMDAWTEVAKSYRYSTPSTDDVLYAMTVGPEDAVLDGFEWTTDEGKAREVAAMYNDAVERSSAELKKAYGMGENSMAQLSEETEKELSPSVVPGAARWLRSLSDVELPCAVISYLDRDQVDVLLEYAGLATYFPPDKRVSASNGYGLETQQLLGAALRVERRPDHCAFFDTTPQSAVIAHEVDMKCVNMIGIYPMYDLLSADSTSREFDDLTAMNLRRLFGERVDDQPMLDMMETQPNKRRKVKTRFWEEGDRF